MAKPIAIPERFGSRRFGRVVGGYLLADGKEYPQPGGSESWQTGMSTLLAPPGATGNEQYGFKPNALLSGGRFDLYGKPLDGWIFCDQTNDARWLIKPNLSTAAEFAEALSITFEIVRFGRMYSQDDYFRDSSSVTKILSDWGQGSGQPAISNISSSSCTNQTVTAGDMHLVSAKTDGSAAIFMVSIQISETDAGPYMPWLQRWPIGFVGVTCLARDDAPPSLSLSVLRSRLNTIGSRTSPSTTDGLALVSLCDDVYGQPISDCFIGTASTKQGVYDAILALFYHNDVVTEMKVDCESSGITICDLPETIEDEARFSQHSTGETRLEWTVKCNGRSASWRYSSLEDMTAYLNCRAGYYWETTITESFNGTDIVTTTSGEETTTEPTMPHAAGAFSYIFTLHTACRSVGDLWMDAFIMTDSKWHSFGFVRYAYNVIGVIVGGQVYARGPALSPSQVIAVADFEGSSLVGAYNARTGESVAGSGVIGFV